MLIWSSYRTQGTHLLHDLLNGLIYWEKLKLDLSRMIRWPSRKLHRIIVWWFHTTTSLWCYHAFSIWLGWETSSFSAFRRNIAWKWSLGELQNSKVSLWHIANNFNKSSKCFSSITPNKKHLVSYFIFGLCLIGMSLYNKLWQRTGNW